jgi:hypothetical protein
MMVNILETSTRQNEKAKFFLPLKSFLSSAIFLKRFTRAISSEINPNAVFINSKVDIGQYYFFYVMSKQLKGEENSSKKSRIFWQLRVASLVFLVVLVAGITLVLNQALNVGGLLIAISVVGQFFLAQIRDQDERSFRRERALRSDFESDRDYQLRKRELMLREAELFLKLNPMPSDEEKKKISDNLLLSPEDADTIE